MTRLATGLALVAFAVYLIFAAPQPVFIGAALLMGVLCFREFAPMVAALGLPAPFWSGLLIGCTLIFFPAFALPVISLILVLQFGLFLQSDNLRNIVPNAACNLLGAFYVFLPWRYAVDLRSVSVHLLFFALALNWIGDSTAFYFGSRFGRHKLAPSISPGKSWEGTIASILGTILFGLVYLHFFLPQVSPWQVLLMAIAGNVAGQTGDLVESSIKRGAGLKDSGSLLPGHGGALDRLDSSLFSLPTVYVLARLFNLF